MEESLMEVVPRLEKRTHYLATFANLATLLGLLGTVIGLIHAFGAVATVNPAEKANLLSASISVAMNCTAFGLMTAVPILFLHALLQTKTTELIDSLEMASVKFLNAITERAPPAVTGLRRRHYASTAAPAVTEALQESQCDGPSPPRRLRARCASRQSCLLVPMIDIFTVLVTFLLMTAVFSKTVVLQLNLPASVTEFREPPPGLHDRSDGAQGPAPGRRS